MRGRTAEVTIFGTDYPTPDGNCNRGYVHVEDLVDIHVRVLEAMADGDFRVRLLSGSLASLV
jgi:UDP-glucose 4-epimerase